MNDSAKKVANTSGTVVRQLVSFFPLDEAIASRAVFVIVSWSDGRADGNAFGAI